MEEAKQEQKAQEQKAGAEAKAGGNLMSESPAEKELAVILVRGIVGVSTRIKEALFTLKLLKKHACVILKDTKEVRGQLQKCKDYVAYGTITPETRALLKARGAKNGVYHLPPPRGGWKSTKKGFSAGGALGNRGSMDALLKRIL